MVWGSINVHISDEYYLQSYQKFRDELLKCGYGLKCNGTTAKSHKCIFPGN